MRKMYGGGMILECIICHRSFLSIHIVDGDFCIDCWDGDVESE